MMERASYLNTQYTRMTAIWLAHFTAVPSLPSPISSPPMLLSSKIFTSVPVFPFLLTSNSSEHQSHLNLFSFSVPLTRPVLFSPSPLPFSSLLRYRISLSFVRHPFANGKFDLFHLTIDPYASCFPSRTSLSPKPSTSNSLEHPLLNCEACNRLIDSLFFFLTSLKTSKVLKPGSRSGFF